MVRSNFALVQALRGIAAFWVVLFHARENGAIEHLIAALPWWAVGLVFDSGHLGVPIFFALSGFVIAHSVRGSQIDLPYLGKFVLRRSVRLDPPYWGSIVVVVAFAALSAAVKGETYRSPGPDQLVAHFFYLQVILGYGAINPVYWTLAFEVQFYLVLIIALVAFRSVCGRTNPVTAALCVFGPLYAVAVVWGVGLIPARPFEAFFFTLWFGFFVGVLGYWAVDDRRLLLPFLGLSAALCLAGSGMGRACALTALLLYATRRIGTIETWLRWRPLQYLGAISYSLYLLHNPLYGASAFILAKVLPDDAPGNALLLAAALVLVIAGTTLFWLTVERPAHRLAKRFSRRAESRPSVPSELNAAS